VPTVNEIMSSSINQQPKLTPRWGLLVDRYIDRILGDNREIGWRPNASVCVLSPQDQTVYSASRSGRHIAGFFGNIRFGTTRLMGKPCLAV
jgi:hypothetical protein